MANRDIRSLDVGMLRAFEALAQERSVSRAAARLFLSQPAVSASLNRLRDTFGDPLFTRTAHGMEPTARALALAPLVDRVLADIATLLAPQHGFDPAASDRIFRIAGSDHASHRLLPELSRRLLASGSRVRIVWEPPGVWSLRDRLHKGELDLGVVARIQLPRDLEVAELYEDHYVYAMRRDHPRAGTLATLDDFCATPQIFLGYGTSTLEDLIDGALARTGHRRHTQIAVSSFGQIVDLLGQGDCAAVMPWRVAQVHEDVLHVQPLPFVLPSYKHIVCWDSRFDADAGSQWMRDQIFEIYGATDRTSKRGKPRAAEGRRGAKRPGAGASTAGDDAPG
ncbi:LysR family transcriptional regulator [Comamonadaceae bacterium G21597-S1]|nr:LysR family transcriptional regulator [Comamonadaceae bacterium G21597-S1]